MGKDPLIVLSAARAFNKIDTLRKWAYIFSACFVPRLQVHKILMCFACSCCIRVSGFRYDRRQDDKLGENSRQHRNAFLILIMQFIIYLGLFLFIKQELLLQMCLSSMTHLYPELSPGRD